MEPNSQERSATLRRLISDHTLMMPGAINALSARLIERMGFEAIYVSGAVLANSVGGAPDTGLMGLADLEQHCKRIADNTRVPIVADADTGFGDVAGVTRTVQVLEAAGVSGIHIEDQVFPKRCGHLDGKSLVPAEAFCEKVAAAVQAKSSTDFLVIARTDARGVEGYDEAVRRARRYIEVGAGAIFPEALVDEEEFRRFAKDVQAPLLANMTEFGKTPYFTVAEFEAMGYAMVIFPVTLQRTAMKAMERVLDTLRREGSQASMIDEMQTRDELYDLVGYNVQIGKDEKRESERRGDKS